MLIITSQKREVTYKPHSYKSKTKDKEDRFMSNMKNNDEQEKERKEKLERSFQDKLRSTAQYSYRYPSKDDNGGFYEK